VEDESGNAIPGAEVSFEFSWVNYLRGREEFDRATEVSNGKGIARHRSKGGVHITASAEGYYAYSKGWASQEMPDRLITIVLREEDEPVAMYSGSVHKRWDGSTSEYNLYLVVDSYSGSAMGGALREVQTREEADIVINIQKAGQGEEPDVNRAQASLITTIESLEAWQLARETSGGDDNISAESVRVARQAGYSSRVQLNGSPAYMVLSVREGGPRIRYGKSEIAVSDFSSRNQTLIVCNVGGSFQVNPGEGRSLNPKRE